MKRQSYFSFGNFNQENNVFQNTHPLMLNCTGYEELVPSHDLRIGDREDYYIMLVDSGTMRLTFDNERRSVNMTVNHLVVISPHTPYRFVCKEGCKYYWMHITGGQIEEYIRWAELPLNTVVSVMNTEALSLLFKQLFNLFQNQDELFYMETMGQVMHILAVMGRMIQKPSVLEKSIAYMHRHFAEPISVEDLARMEAKSVSQYRKDFVAKFGQSPKQYLTELRLSVACHLLKATEDKVEFIAQQSGYEDYHYFCRLFHRHIGCTPTEYRN